MLKVCTRVFRKMISRLFRRVRRESPKGEINDFENFLELRQGMLSEEAILEGEQYEQALNKARALYEERLPDLLLNHRGEFASIQEGKLMIGKNVEELQASLRHDIPFLILQIEPPRLVKETESEGSIHERAYQTYWQHLDEMLKEHEGEWVAIHEDQILGYSKDRHDLLSKYYREEFLPVLFMSVQKQTAPTPPTN